MATVCQEVLNAPGSPILHSVTSQGGWPSRSKMALPRHSCLLQGVDCRAKGWPAGCQERLLESGLLDFACILFGIFTYMFIGSISLSFSFTTPILIFVWKSCMNLGLFLLRRFGIVHMKNILSWEILWEDWNNCFSQFHVY